MQPTKESFAARSFICSDATAAAFREDVKEGCFERKATYQRKATTYKRKATTEEKLEPKKEPNKEKQKHNRSDDTAFREDVKEGRFESKATTKTTKNRKLPKKS